MADRIVLGEFQKSARERVAVAFDKYAGHDLIDVRVTVPLTESSGLWAPTKKGLSLRIAQLPQLVALLVSAEAKARAEGLIGGDA